MNGVVPGIRDEDTKKAYRAPSRSRYIGVTGEEEHFDEIKSLEQEMPVNSKSHKLKESNIENLRNLFIGVLSGFGFIVLPWLVFSEILGIELICFDSDNPDSTAQDCQNESQRWSQWAFALFWIIFVHIFSILFAGIVEDPSGEKHSAIRKFFPIPSFICIILTMIDFQLIIIIGPIFAMTGFVLALILSKRWNRGGIILCAFSFSQFMFMSIVMRLLSSYIKQDFILGFKYTILVPFLVQLNEGGLITLCERIHKLVQVTPFNADYIMFILKYQIVYLSSWKLAGLLPVIEEDDLYPTLATSVVLDILGRNQVWRILFRFLKSKTSHTTFSNPEMSAISKTVLSSQLDMNYLPPLNLLLISTCNSLMVTHELTHSQVSDSHLTLKEDSLLNVSTKGLLAVILAAVIADFGTLLLSKLLGKLRVYRIECKFSKSKLNSCIYGTMLVTTASYTIIGAADLLAQSESDNATLLLSKTLGKRSSHNKSCVDLPEGNSTHALMA